MTLPAPYYRDEANGVTLYCGDALSMVGDLYREDVAAVISDPPYGMRNDCEYTRFTIGPNGHGQPTLRNYPPVVGDDTPFDPSPWLEFPRVVLWGANHYAQRLPVGTTLVWLKRLDEAFGSFLSDAEIGWMKGGNGVYCKRDLSNNRKPQERVHATQKPVGLMLWCLEKARVPVGELVLDPYAGSATVAVACLRTGRPSISIEIEERYCAIAANRLRKEAKRFPLFEQPAKRQRQLECVID